jgi:ABC-type spermidine/putrescine transport system permease subunit I
MRVASERAVYRDPVILILPVVIPFVLFLLVPLAIFFVYSFLTAKLFSVSGPLTLDAYGRAFSTALNAELAINSLAIGLLGASASLLIALPLAYWLRYRAGRLAVPLLFIITASMFASYLVRIYAWRTILGGSGIINQGLIAMGIISEPLGFLLYNWFSVIIALVHIFLPYVVLVLYAGFRSIEPALLEVAQDLGANAPERWRRVILPLIAGPAVTSFLFVFVLSASDYVTPQLIGGTSGQMLGVQIQSNFKAVGDWPQGAALSVLMLLAFLACCYGVYVGLRALRIENPKWAG